MNVYMCVFVCLRMSQCIVRKLLFGAAIVHFNLQRKRISVILGIISQYCKISLTHNEYNEAEIVKRVPDHKVRNCRH